MEALSKKADSKQTSELEQIKAQLERQIQLTQIAQAELQKLKNQLEKQVSQKTEHLTQENAQLRRQLQRKQRYIASLRQIQKFAYVWLATTNNLAVVMDSEKRILYFNRACEKTTGYLFEEVRGKQVHELFLLPEEKSKVDAVCGKINPDNSPNYCENYWLTKDGEHRLIQWSNTPILNENGEVNYIIATGVDITDSKQTEQALKESQLFIQRVTEAIPGIIYIYNVKENRNIYSNYKVKDILGYTPAQVRELGSAFLPTVMHPDDFAKVHENMELISKLPDGEILEIEYRLRNAKGKWRWFLGLDLVFSRQSDGLPVETLGIVIDINDRKLAEEKLTQETAKLSAILRALPDLYARLDANGTYLDYQVPTPNIYGFMENQFVGKKLSEVLPPEISKQSENALQRVLQNRELVLLEMCWHKPNVSQWYECRMFPVLEQEVIALVRNITAQKQAEILLNQTKEELEIKVEERTAELSIINQQLRQEIAERQRVEVQLRESEERFRSIFNQAAVGIALVTISGDFMLVNQQLSVMMGYEAEELLQKRSADITHPDDIKTCEQARERMLANLIETFSSEKRYLCKDGSQIWGSVTISLLRDELGNPKYFIYILKDITDRKKIEFALQESEAKLQKIVVILLESERRLQAILTNLFDAVLIVSKLGKITFANPAAGKLFNQTPEDLLSQEFGLPLAMNNTVEVGIVKSKKEIALAEMSVVEIPGEEQQYVVSLRDITERTNAEEALRESEELFRQLAENIQDVFWLFTAYENKTLYISPAYEQIWGSSCEEMYADHNSWLKAIHPEDWEAVDKFIAEYREGKHTNIEYRIIRPDGSLRWIWDRAFPIYNDLGELVRIAGIAEDITERKNTEAKIKASLAEKEILLKEIYHRVKNNMQVISSLLQLQCQSIDDPKIIDLFQDSQSRIRSMALVHEQLYQSEHLDRVEFPKYVQNLVANILQSFSLSSQRIEISLSIAEIFLNVETAIPCGLIINEIVSNSLKYAFPSGKSGQIRIEFSELPSQKLYLSIGDNGIGLPPNFNVETTQSLGLRLVRMLTHQLKGILEINQNDGISYKITFNRLNYNRRL